MTDADTDESERGFEIPPFVQAPASVPPRGEAILKAVTDYYLKSHDFNGLPVSAISGSPEKRRTALHELVSSGRISLNFGDAHPNTHIKAFVADNVETQLKKLVSADLTHVCAYPTPEHLSQIVNKAEYHGRPFSLRLALGDGQLELKAFDLKVLENYRNDPRYHYETDGIQGRISVTDEYGQSAKMKTSDKVLLKAFGFGYDTDWNSAVMAFVWDLAQLSPEHQQKWHSELLPGNFEPHPDFWRAMMGNWPERASIFSAFAAELSVINQMARLMGRPDFFHKDFSGGKRPREFAPLIRPTLHEFNAFAHLLDKMMSDNINVKFFEGEVDTERLEKRADGMYVAKPVGTIFMLEEWFKRVRFPDPAPKDKMLGVFREVRQLRVNPAHVVDENMFDQKYFEEQHNLIIRAYEAVRTLRLILANHPATKACQIPDWLYRGEIWTR